MSKKQTHSNATGEKIVCVNRKARFQYEIDAVYEAGLSLKGSEVKSLRDGKAHLSEAFVAIQGGEAFLCQAHIAPYSHASHFNHEPDQRRKLLLHKYEILRLHERVREKGYTLVPMRLYFKGGKAKLEFGVGKGKKLHDKRASLKESDAKREVQRALRERVRG